MHYKDFIFEGVDEAAVIRTALKKEYGLTNKDVSVKARSGGTSSSVTVSIKSLKAIALKEKIKNISKLQQNYDTDAATGEILSGGNTFIFVNIDQSLKDEIADKIQEEFERESKGSWTDGDNIKLYGTFNVMNKDGETYASMKGGIVVEVGEVKHIGSYILQLIDRMKDDDLYSKIK